MRNKKAISLKQIYLLLMICMLPLIGGTLLYQFRDHFHFKTINHGVLLNPPIQMQSLKIMNEKKWRIVYMPDQCCDKQCMEILYSLHQLKKLFNKDSQRISLVLAAKQSCKINNRYDFQKLLLNSQQYLQWQAAFDKTVEMTNKIYLIDPMNNLFMYYPASVNPLDILKDLKRVLEVSSIG